MIIALLVILFCFVLFAAKGQVEEAYDEVAQEAIREGKNPPGYVTGSSTTDAGCLLIVTAIVALGILALLAGALPPGVLLPNVKAQDATVAEVDPDWNLKITPFSDVNENGTFDTGEHFLSATGWITYTGISRSWDATNGPSYIRIPYEVVFQLSGGPVGTGQYDCPLITRQMIAESVNEHAEVVYACDPFTFSEFLYRLWISLVDGGENRSIQPAGILLPE